MLVPEPEPPKHLQHSEVNAALASFVQDPGEMARALKVARVRAHGLPAMNEKDLLQEAMVRLMSGARTWPRELPTLVILSGVMRSIASNARKKEDYVLADDVGAPSDDDSKEEPSPLAEGISAETNPARTVEAESDLAVVQNAVKGDEMLELLVEALAEGLTGMDIAKELGWDSKTYDATRKRLSRRLAALKTDRSEP
ncbi:MAG: sigma-70 family RNA polymerase sigma factor [Gammaproteobacteria bacterium]|nr:sigma-70 family RNA polymerase sigma factor [Gammaproteobacteria bacterium]